MMNTRFTYNWTPRLCSHEQIERCVGWNEEQRVVFERSFALHMDGFQRVVPVVTHMLVELVVLFGGDLVPGTRPERPHRVDSLDFAGGLAILDRALDLHPDRPRDEVGVPPDDLLDLPGVRIVEEVVLLVLGLEMQGDRGALGRVVDRLQCVSPLATGLPAHTLALSGALRQQRDLVGHHEAGIEADTELPDEILRSRGVLRLLELPQVLSRTRFRDGADEMHHLVP